MNSGTYSRNVGCRQVADSTSNTEGSQPFLCPIVDFRPVAESSSNTVGRKSINPSIVDHEPAHKAVGCRSIKYFTLPPIVQRSTDNIKEKLPMHKKSSTLMPNSRIHALSVCSEVKLPRIPTAFPRKPKTNKHPHSKSQSFQKNLKPSMEEQLDQTLRMNKFVVPKNKEYGVVLAEKSFQLDTYSNMHRAFDIKCQFCAQIQMIHKFEKQSGVKCSQATRKNLLHQNNMLLFNTKQKARKCLASILCMYRNDEPQKVQNTLKKEKARCLKKLEKSKDDYEAYNS